MIGQVHSNIRNIDDISVRRELSATEGFDIDETPRPAAGRCIGCAGAERITNLCVGCHVCARGWEPRESTHHTARTRAYN